jgi:hypothetical protein
MAVSDLTIAELIQLRGFIANARKLSLPATGS